eukprot:XP_001709818.1 Hypothetical protein GL50803_37037 [Giardia lamblia ATCC 50803]
MLFCALLRQATEGKKLSESLDILAHVGRCSHLEHHLVIEALHLSLQCFIGRRRNAFCLYFVLDGIYHLRLIGVYAILIP